MYSEKNIRLFLLDEVQLKTDWSDWLIQVIDSYPSAKFVITGSSTLNLEKRETGLDRTRKINIQTLSFGEYITITGKDKNENAFNEFLGNGFPKYALQPEETFDLQRSEIIDEILANDIPKDYPNVVSDLITRLLYTIANLTNGEVNVSNLVRQVSPNFREREALEYISILEKAKILIKINRINSDLELPQRRKFKLYINPHIHLWLLDKKFSEVDSKAKGHIFESYWLHWALTINSSSKTFYYLKNESDLEIDFVSLEIINGKKHIKTMHEFKLHSNKRRELELMKSLKAKNKLLWSIEGTGIGEIIGKSILDTFDKEI